jgi:hypothetical protein
MKEQEQNPKIDGNGVKRWRNEKNKLHRLNGPAIVDNGYEAWWVNGKRHRLDGPAMTWPDGINEWWVNGKELTQQGFERHPLVVFYRLSKTV